MIGRLESPCDSHCPLFFAYRELVERFPDRADSPALVGKAVKMIGKLVVGLNRPVWTNCPQHLGTGPARLQCYQKATEILNKEHIRHQWLTTDDGYPDLFTPDGRQ